MEFNEKLRMLRKQKGLTQEELAGALYVSRTAVSKWESGRGYPNIDSLKAISDFFSVTLDELISAGELASADEPSPSPEPEREPPDSRPRSLLFALSDISAAAFLFLPLFAHRPDGAVRAVSLLFLTGIAPYMKAAYLPLFLRPGPPYGHFRVLGKLKNPLTHGTMIPVRFNPIHRNLSNSRNEVRVPLCKRSCQRS